MRILDYLYRDDIFISYSRKDGVLYAAGLADKLTGRKLSCFLDRLGTQPGYDLPNSFKRKIRSCKVFVLIGTPEAAKSESIAKEIDEFKKTGRTILPIDFAGAVERSNWYQLIPGLPTETEGELRAIGTGEPSPNVIAFIEKSFSYVRRNQLMLRMFWAVLFIFLALVGSSIAAFYFAQSQVAKATEATRFAEEQTTLAGEAKREAEKQKNIAEEQAAKAKQATLNANQMTLLAKSKTAEAAKATVLAQRKANEAQTAETKAAQAAWRQQAAEDNATSIEEASAAISLLPFDPEESVLTSARAFRRARTEQAEVALRRSLFASFIQTTLHGHQGAVSDVSFDKSGSLAVTASSDRTARVWSPRSGKQFAELYSDGRLSEIAVSPDGKYIAAVNTDRNDTALLWEWQKESERRRPHVLQNIVRKCEWGESEPPTSCYGRKTFIAFSPDSRYIATGGWQGVVSVWETATGKLVASMADYAHWINSVVFSSNGEYILTAGPGCRALLWKWQAVRDEANPRVLSHPDREVQTATFGGQNDEYILTSSRPDDYCWINDLSPNITLKDFSALSAKHEQGTRPISALSTDAVWVWRADTDTKEPDAKLFADELMWDTHALLSPDGNIVVAWDLSGAQSNTDALMWRWKEPTDRSRPVLLRGHTGPVTDVSISPDSKHIITSSTDGTARLWRLTTSAKSPLVAVFRGHRGSINKVTVSTDGTLVATASDDGTARVWKNPTGNLVGELRGRLSDVWNPPLLPGRTGLILETATKEHPMNVWMWSDKGKPLTYMASLQPSPGMFFRRAFFSPDGNNVAAVIQSENSTLFCPGEQLIAVWDWRVRGGEGIITFGRHEDGIQSVHFSNGDGRYVVTTRPLNSQSPDRNAIRVWNWKDETARDRPLVLIGHTESVEDAVFSSDNRYIVSAGRDGTVRVWDWQSTTDRLKPVILTGAGRLDTFSKVAISPDGRYVAAINNSLPSTALVWQWQSEEGRDNPVRLVGASDQLDSIAFSLDGKIILTGSFYGTFQLWDSRTGNLLSTIKSGDDLFTHTSFVHDSTMIFALGAEKAKFYSCEACATADKLLDLVPQYISPQILRKQGAIGFDKQLHLPPRERELQGTTALERH